MIIASASAMPLYVGMAIIVIFLIAMIRMSGKVAQEIGP